MTNTEDNINWEEKIDNMLVGIESNAEDFKKDVKAMSIIHARLLDSIRNEWNNYRPPVLRERAFQIDFVGRTFAGHGKVELAIEVDTWNMPTGNWVKLLDINTTNKFWIYLCREPDKANIRLEEALKEFRRLATLRKEDKINDVTIFMKVVGKSEVEKRHLFEKEGN